MSDRWMRFIERDELLLCAPVRLELLYSARGKAEFASLAYQLEGFKELELGRDATALASRTQAALAERSQHRGPTPVDLLIAAIAEAAGVTLLHYDRHFDAIARVTGQPTEWLAPRGSLR